MEKKERWKYLWLGLFAAAMAFLETAVVIYLRKLYSPSGFNFPLSLGIPHNVLVIEWVREICTIIMLGVVAFIAAKKSYHKFAYFLYAFAIWDIFYYIWLRIITGWPASVFTWDLLFLIPVPWAGPVLAPLIVSLTMIALSLLIVYFEPKKINAAEWILLGAGAFLILITFLKDYMMVIINNGFLMQFSKLATISEFQSLIGSYIPSNYMWGLFILGEIVVIIGIVFIWRNIKLKL